MMRLILSAAMIFATVLATLLVGCGAGKPAASPIAATQPADRRIPVILDTDIGDDIDDTWALAMLLKSPQFDVRLITTTNGRQEYRAKIIARLLTIAGRSDVPIGLGAGEFQGVGKQQPWVEDYRLEQFRGRVEPDGVGALIAAVHRSTQPITVIAIGPLQTIAAAVKRDPTVAGNVNFVGMQGSVYHGYGGSPNPEPEWNVKSDIPASRIAFAAPWRTAAITPLDTCGVDGMKLAGARFLSLRQSRDPLTAAVLENDAIWSRPSTPSRGPATSVAGHRDEIARLTESTTLFDTVAIYLADPANHPLIQLEPLKLAVNDAGATVISPTGAPFAVATRWIDLDGYLDHLVTMLQIPAKQDSVHRPLDGAALVQINLKPFAPVHFTSSTTFEN